MEFLEEIVVVCDERFRTNATLGNVAAERFAPRAKILNFDTVLGRPVERNLDAIHVVQRNAEARAELAQLIFVEFLLLVGDVLAFPRFAEPIALDGARENHGGTAPVVHGRFVRCVNLARIVPAKTQAAQGLVRKRLDELEQTRITAKEMLANIRAGGHHQLLVISVHRLTHALDQQPFGIAFENRIPLTSPKNFDHVPSGAAERGFELLDDLSIAAHGAVEALQIAVDDKNQVVELLPRSKSDRAERFRFVGLAVTQKCPDLRVRGWLHAAILEITVKARLINRHQRAKTHGNGRKLPEIWHQPRMRVGRKSAAGLRLTTKVFQLLRADAAFQEGARVHPRRSVPLKINRVAFEFFGARAEEMVETHFVECGR